MVREGWHRVCFSREESLTAAATIAYTQLLWQTVRSTAIPIGGVDKLFGRTTHAWNLASLNVWQNGPLAAVVGVFIWLVAFLKLC